MKTLKIGVIAFSIMLMSCKKSTSTGAATLTEGTVTQISVTQSISVGQTVPVSVTFYGNGGGDNVPDKLQSIVENKLVKVKAFYKYLKSPTASSAAPYFTMTFDFTPGYAGAWVIQPDPISGVSDTLMVY